MASLRAKIVRRISRLYIRSIDVRKADVPSMRRKWHALAQRLPVATGTRHEAAALAGVPVEWLVPAGAPDDAVLLYFHGGAYLLGSPLTHRQLASHIATRTGLRAVLPDYRLAPEHRFPAAVDDATGVYRALLADGFDPASIVVGGDSAGGGLTMAMLLSLREQNVPLPALAVLLSPWLDLTGSGESMQTHAERDPWFRPDDLGVVTRYYCDDDQLTNPLVSPVFADLHGLPPVHVQVGSDEILLSDSERLVAGIEASGGRAELDVWPDMWHVFQMFVQHVPEARAALDRLAEQIRAAVPAGQASEA